MPEVSFWFTAPCDAWKMAWRLLHSLCKHKGTAWNHIQQPMGKWWLLHSLCKHKGTAWNHIQQPMGKWWLLHSLCKHKGTAWNHIQQPMGKWWLLHSLCKHKGTVWNHIQQPMGKWWLLHSLCKHKGTVWNHIHQPMGKWWHALIVVSEGSASPQNENTAVDQRWTISYSNYKMEKTKGKQAGLKIPYVWHHCLPRGLYLTTERG